MYRLYSASLYPMLLYLCISQLCHHTSFCHLGFWCLDDNQALLMNDECYYNKLPRKPFFVKAPEHCP